MTSAVNSSELVIPGRKPQEKYVRLVGGVLTADECKEWIAFAESQGFQPASLVSAAVKNPHRSNDRVLIVDEKRAAILTQRLVPYLPPTWDEWKLVGLNDHMSFLRYANAERYGRHLDVPYEDEKHHVRSFITCQLYLNEGFIGGETRFDQEVGYKDFHSRSHLDVVPQSGAALLFEHELTHEGCAVTAGTKYTVRIDVLYCHEKI